MSATIRVVVHADLTGDDLEGPRALFGAEYLRDFGEWDPDQPYGYAPHDVHVVARDDGVTVGHVGWARREISVGSGLS